LESIASIVAWVPSRDFSLFFCSVDDDDDGKGDGEAEADEEMLLKISGMCAVLCFTTRCPRHLLSGDFGAVLKGTIEKY